MRLSPRPLPTVLLVGQPPGSLDELRLEGIARARGASPAEAAAELARTPTDAVILGPTLPVGDALELARRLRRERPDLALLVLFAEVPSEERLRDALAPGLVDVATPPFLPELLGARLSGLLARSQARAAGPSRELGVVVESVPALLSYVDRERRYRFVNRAYETWFGRRREEVVGRTMAEVLGDAAWAVIRPYVDRALAGERVTYTVEAPYRDGGARWIDATYVPDVGEQGEVRGVAVLVHDASARREAEEALRRGEEEFRTLFQLSAAGIAQADPATGRFVRVNEPFCEITGYSEAELLARTFLDITHPDDRPRDRAVAMPVFRGEAERWESEKRYVRPDGRSVWVHVSGRMLRDASGRPVRTLASVLDVTERRAAEEALRASEERFRALSDGAPVAIEVSRDGLVLYANPAYRQLFGLGAEEPVVGGGSVLRGLDPSTREELRRAVAAGEHRSFELTATRGDGARFLTQVEVGQIGLPDGLAKLAFVADVTERRRAEDRARFLLRLDDAVRPLTDAGAITSAVARRLGEFLDVDRCAYAQVGPDEDTFDLTGDHVRGVKSIVGRYRFADFGAEVLHRMRADQTYVVDDVEARREPPEVLAAYRATDIRSVVCVPLHKGGRLAAAMAVHQRTPRAWRADEVDLVRAVASRAWESIERARALRELRDSERALQEADRRKDEFLATLAHELRNPLAPVSYALQVWPVVASDPARTDELRALMERQVRQMTRLIDDLLDVSRISRGKIELRRDRLDLATVVGGALEAVRPFVDAARHQLVVRMPEEPLTIDGDAGRLVQVFGNLLHNAAKYTGRNGHLEVTVAREGGDAVVRVRDDGPGIPEDMLDTIFDMFAQVDQTLHRSQGGLGLGLTLVRTLVELHGGSVEAHSGGAGKGAEFVVRLPALRDATTPVRAADRSLAGEVAARRLRVLVLDDVRASADTLGMMLSALGQDVRVAYDGEGALALAEDFGPRVVFCDVAMPGMDGYEVARRLRSSLGSAPVLVALTGYGQEEDRRRAVEAGFDHHLVKPASVDALCEVIDGVPDEARPATPP